MHITSPSACLLRALLLVDPNSVADTSQQWCHKYYLNDTNDVRMLLDA
jgi:hypothetical protein